MPYRIVDNHVGATNFKTVFEAPENLSCLASFLDAHTASKMMRAIQFSQAEKETIVDALPLRQQQRFMRRSPAFASAMVRKMTDTHELKTDRTVNKARTPIQSSRQAVNASWAAARVDLTAVNGLKGRADYVEHSFDWLAKVNFSNLGSQENKDLRVQVRKVLEELTAALALPSSAQMHDIDVARSRLRPYVEAFLDKSPTIDCPKLIKHWANVSLAQRDRTSSDFAFLTKLAIEKPMGGAVRNTLDLFCADALRNRAVDDPAVQEAMLTQIMRDVVEGSIHKSLMDDLLDGVSAGLRQGIHNSKIALALDVATVLIRAPGYWSPTVALRIYDQLGGMNFAGVSLELSQSMRRVQSDFICEALKTFSETLIEHPVAPEQHHQPMLRLIQTGVNSGHADQRTVEHTLVQLAKSIAPRRIHLLSQSNAGLAKQILSDAINGGWITFSREANGMLAGNLLFGVSPSARPGWNREMLADAGHLVRSGIAPDFAEGILINLALILAKREVNDADSRRMVVEMMESLCHHDIPESGKNDFVEIMKHVHIPAAESDVHAQMQRVINRLHNRNDR